MVGGETRERTRVLRFDRRIQYLQVYDDGTQNHGRRLDRLYDAGILTKVYGRVQ